MPPEDIPGEREQTFPCECGGEIARFGDCWECDICNFKKRENIESTITS